MREGSDFWGAAGPTDQWANWSQTFSLEPPIIAPNHFPSHFKLNWS